MDEQSALNERVNSRFSNQINKIIAVKDFLTNNLVLIRWLNKYYFDTVLTHIDTIHKWISHPDTAQSFCLLTEEYGKAFMDLKSALASTRDKGSPHYAVVYVSTIGMYGVYNPTEFKTFIAKFEKVVNSCDYTWYMLSYRPQRFIFSNEIYKEELAKYPERPVKEITIAELATLEPSDQHVIYKLNI
jgi:hypothetical protein